MNEVFVADVHRTQRIWTERPELAVPPSQPGRGRPAHKRQALRAPVTVESLVKGSGSGDWTRCVLRDSTRGELRVDLAHRLVWVWDGEEETPRCWHLIVRREVKSEKTIKYTLSNAPADTLLLRLGQMQGQRYWVERTFEGRLWLRGSTSATNADAVPSHRASALKLSEHHDAGLAIRQACDENTKLASYVCALSGPALLISYEEAMQNAEYMVDKVCAFCGLTPGDGQRAAALAAIIPNHPDYISSTQVEYRGTIDNISRNILRGWCRHQESFEAVEIEVFVDHDRIRVFLAGDYRDDLRQAAIGVGFHAFNVDLKAFRIPSSAVISVGPVGSTEALHRSYRSVEFLRKLDQYARRMKIKILMMLKDEDDLALLWIKYHGSLVGYENLVILDNGSTSERTLATLHYGAEAGATVSYQYATQTDFVRRGHIYVDLIKRMDAEDLADFYLPLDCDEFLSVERDGRIDCGVSALEEALSQYVNSPNSLVIYAGLDNHPHKAGFFRWSPSQRKTLFAKAACEVLDHGFHVGKSRLGLDPIQTKPVYIHYHYKPYNLSIEHSKLKPQPFTTDFSPGNMKKYVDGKKDAWHCAAHILTSEEDYAHGFTHSAFVEFPEIQEKFDLIGGYLPFSDYPIV